MNLNVNLAKCPTGADTCSGATCTAAPLPLPCLIPRTVEMTVRLGECSCGEEEMRASGRPHRTTGHWEKCPARPIRVTCSIGGETWEASHINTCETEDGIGLNTTVEHAICRDRWEVVKVILLGAGRGIGHARLCEQRDAVFAALAKMAKAEQVVAEQDDVLEHHFHLALNPQSHSSLRLAAYVSHLIAKVGVM